MPLWPLVLVAAFAWDAAWDAIFERHAVVRAGEEITRRKVRVVVALLVVGVLVHWGMAFAAGFTAPVPGVTTSSGAGGVLVGLMSLFHDVPRLTRVARAPGMRWKLRAFLVVCLAIDAAFGVLGGWVRTRVG